MKKTLLFTLLISAGFAASAQRYSDVSVDSIIEPSRLDTYEDGQAIKTQWPIHTIMTNHGPDAIEVGDTVVWAARLTDIAANTVKTDVPGGGKVYALVLDRKINANDTFHFNYEFTLTGGMALSKDFRMMFYCAGYSGKDTVTANNIKESELVWYNINGWNVSTDEVDFEHNIKTHPNPANNELLVQLLEINFNTVSIELYDVTGKLVHKEDQTGEFAGQAYRLNTSALENGIYLLKVVDGDKVSTSKVVIRH